MHPHIVHRTVQPAPRDKAAAHSAAATQSKAAARLDGAVDLSKKRRHRSEDFPTVSYEVTLKGIECEFDVFEFVHPDLVMECVSPLATVIPLFIRLQVARTCKMRCEVRLRPPLPAFLPPPPPL